MVGSESIRPERSATASSAVASTKSVSAASLTTEGMRMLCSIIAVAPCASQIWAITQRSSWSIRSYAAGDPSRVLIASVAAIGMMLWLLPPWNWVTVTTPDSSGDRRRDTTLCSPCTTAVPTKIGSIAKSGREAWPPLPEMVTS